MSNGVERNAERKTENGEMLRKDRCTSVERNLRRYMLQSVSGRFWAKGMPLRRRGVDSKLANIL